MGAQRCSEESGHKKRHKCTTCGKVFNRKGDLDRHKKTHTGEKSHVCETCGRAFTLKGDLKRHGKTHTGERPHECTTCGRAFALKRDLTRHGKTHSNKRPHECTTCGKAFKSEENLKTHNKTHANKRSYKCLYSGCNWAFTTASNLANHRITHIDEKLYKCSYQECDWASKWNGDLKTHKLTHTNVRPYKCPKPGCGKAFKEEKILKRHERTPHTSKKPFQCKSCGKSFKTRHNCKTRRVGDNGLRDDCALTNAAQPTRSIVPSQAAASHTEETGGELQHEPVHPDSPSPSPSPSPPCISRDSTPPALSSTMAASATQGALSRHSGEMDMPVDPLLRSHDDPWDAGDPDCVSERASPTEDNKTTTSEDKALQPLVEGLVAESVSEHLPGCTVQQLEQRLQHLEEHSRPEPVPSPSATSRTTVERPGEFMCDRCHTGFPSEDHLKKHDENVKDCAKAMSDARFKQWLGPSTSSTPESDERLHRSSRSSSATPDGASHEQARGAPAVAGVTLPLLRGSNGLDCEADRPYDESDARPHDTARRGRKRKADNISSTCNPSKKVRNCLSQVGGTPDTLSTPGPDFPQDTDDGAPDDAWRELPLPMSLDSGSSERDMAAVLAAVLAPPPASQLQDHAEVLSASDQGVIPEELRMHYTSLLLSASSHSPSGGSVRLSGVASNGSASGHATPTPSSRSGGRHLGATSEPKGQSAFPTEWTAEEIASQLKTYSRDVRYDHTQLVAYAIESTKAPEQRTLCGKDLFAGVTTALENNKTMKVKFKLHPQAKPTGRMDQQEERCKVVRIKTNKEAVPAYQFHTEIKKSVLAANTNLTFVPHPHDLDSSEEAKYNRWLDGLEDIDRQSGFKPMSREEKHNLVVQSERAATISLYLDSWLNTLNIPKSALSGYMASQKADDATTPQQKTGDPMTPENKAAEMFAEAFQLVFNEDQPISKRVDLRKVLRFGDPVNSVMDDISAAREDTPQDEDDVADANLNTYHILGCLVCFAHSCDHGDYGNDNQKRTFSLSSGASFSDILKRRRILATKTSSKNKTPCQRRCHRLNVSSDSDIQLKPWSEDERVVLRSLYATADHSKMDPICLAAAFFNRNCCEVYTEFQSLNIPIPQPEPTEPTEPPHISWYDRQKKMLLENWKSHIVSHGQRPEVFERCFHNGPCAPKVCSCVDAGVLCEKFCGCTVENCSYKFTGCACSARDKACYADQKDEPCICVQLNRECDPQLCGSCGALERADPAEVDNQLYSSGCQNCELQRGVQKTLVLGRSRLQGVGYGLFTAEDIVQGDFIIEYVGEIITHDEGERREARRSNVFDEKSNVSYMFTLLEDSGIWIDAAKFGNLSRYINHAADGACNIIPQILYVNGEFRIKFKALRDIKAGDELFFNYGANFPNLTKKLLDHNEPGEKPRAAKGKKGRPLHRRVGRRVTEGSTTHKRRQTMAHDPTQSHKTPRSYRAEELNTSGPLDRRRVTRSMRGEQDRVIAEKPESHSSRRSQRR